MYSSEIIFRIRTKTHPHSTYTHKHRIHKQHMTFLKAFKQVSFAMCILNQSNHLHVLCYYFFPQTSLLEYGEMRNLRFLQFQVSHVARLSIKHFLCCETQETVVLNPSETVVFRVWLYACLRCPGQLRTSARIDHM